MEYDKLVYVRGSLSKEAQRIEFAVSNDLSITEFKRTCKRLAYALGYSTSLVDTHFGNDTEKGNIKQLQILFD